MAVSASIEVDFIGLLLAERLRRERGAGATAVGPRRSCLDEVSVHQLEHGEESTANRAGNTPSHTRVAALAWGRTSSRVGKGVARIRLLF